MNTKSLNCRQCGTVLALAAENDGEGFIVHSPAGASIPIYIIPQCRISLRCPVCGQLRTWHPPARRHKARPRVQVEVTS